MVTLTITTKIRSLSISNRARGPKRKKCSNFSTLDNAELKWNPTHGGVAKSRVYRIDAYRSNKCIRFIVEEYLRRENDAEHEKNWM